MFWTALTQQEHFYLPDEDAHEELGAIGTGPSAQAGPLTNGPLGPECRTVGLDAYPRRLFPAGVSRSTVAAAMLDEAESPRYPGAIAIPLER
jgi:hypothetical protein